VSLAALLGVTAGAGALGLVEAAGHRRRLAQLRTRVHVNGTRGKSSVTRLVAAGLRAAGVRTTATTTGTLARVILPDASERPVYRPSGASVIEQLRVVRAAVEAGSEALVIECMALRPELQTFSEQALIRAHVGVVTNVRPDHLEVMGPTVADVARALAGTTPWGGVLVTAERRYVDVFAEAARRRGARLVESPGPSSVTAEELAGFTYVEHAENVALALAVLAELGVERARALPGLWGAAPDPGALTVDAVEAFGRRVVLVNGFAANDPESSRAIWDRAASFAPEAAARVLVVSCRDDRPHRSLQLADAIPGWAAPTRLLAIGTGTGTFTRRLLARGFAPSALVVAEDEDAARVFERLLELADGDALVCGVGNIAGFGLDIVGYVRRRTRPSARVSTRPSLRAGEGAR
jgi:poly-gamma-glutamate synthase PgsB/CapB